MIIRIVREIGYVVGLFFEVNILPLKLNHSCIARSFLRVHHQLFDLPSLSWQCQILSQTIQYWDILAIYFRAIHCLSYVDGPVISMSACDKSTFHNVSIKIETRRWYFLSRYWRYFVSIISTPVTRHYSRRTGRHFLWSCEGGWQY